MGRGRPGTRAGSAGLHESRRAGFGLWAPAWRSLWRARGSCAEDSPARVTQEGRLPGSPQFGFGPRESLPPSSGSTVKPGSNSATASAAQFWQIPFPSRGVSVFSTVNQALELSPHRAGTRLKAAVCCVSGALRRVWPAGGAHQNPRVMPHYVLCAFHSAWYSSPLP